MEVRLTKIAQKQYKKLPQFLRNKADKQFEYLVQNIKHPSLDIKKYDTKTKTYQGRIDKKYRFFFYIQNPNYIVISIINHPK